MKKPKVIWILFYLVAIVSFSLALNHWFEAKVFLPETPEPAPLNHFSFAKTEAKVSQNRYQKLINGELFFEKDPAQINIILFKSQLKVLGIISGKSSRALVGVQGDQINTWIVKPGDVVAGEKILAIGSNYIKVKNTSGEGKVKVNYAK